MCVVSMISDHYMEQYPSPYTVPIDQYPGYLELLRKAKLYDEMMQQPDCPAPAKVEWQKELEKHMLEKYGISPIAIRQKLVNEKSPKPAKRKTKRTPDPEDWATVNKQK